MQVRGRLREPVAKASPRSAGGALIRVNDNGDSAFWLVIELSADDLKRLCEAPECDDEVSE